MALPSPLTRAHLELGPVLANVFQELRMGAAITDGQTWHVVYGLPNVVLFELAHGVEKRREVHNARSIARARKRGRALVTSHAGFCDLYVPVMPGGDTVLVTGPFCVTRPTSGEIRARWRWLTGTHARAADPELGRYLAMTLATATFDDATLGVVTRFAETFCRLLGGRGPAESIAADASALREKLTAVRLVDRCWEAAADLIDESTSRAWTSPHWAEHLRLAGAERLPSHAIVGLLAGRADDPDPIDELLRRDAFQRASVHLARKIGGIVCGRIGGHGVLLLVDDASRGVRMRHKLLAIADRARALGRRFGLALHVGISDPDDDAPLPSLHRAALSAADKALTKGQPIVMATRGASRVISPLGVLRRELTRAVVGAPASLGPRFDGYLEAAAAHTAHRLEPTRAHVEAAFEQIVDALQATGALDERSLEELRGELEHAAKAETVRDLFIAFRSAARGVQDAVLSPTQARQDRSVRRATAFIREHISEPLPLPRVARAAGFEQNYFSKAFARAEGMTLLHYIRKVRVERAKQMLASSALGVERIGQLSGFGTKTSFHKAFHETLHTTPGAYRRGVLRAAKTVTSKH